MKAREKKLTKLCLYFIRAGTTAVTLLLNILQVISSETLVILMIYPAKGAWYDAF